MLKKYADTVAIPAWGGVVPSNVESYLARTSLTKRFWQRLKRDFLLLITCQIFLRQEKLPIKAKRVLYVYLGAQQLGDSIMDLSPRLLWAEAGLQVDMFTHESIKSIYDQDPSFNKILTSPSELGEAYDLVVLQSYNVKCLKFKWLYFFSAQFVTLYGHYYGPEFNRLEFAEGAWRYLLNMGVERLSCSVRPVFNLRIDHAEKMRKSNQIVLAIGGVVSWRTYPYWEDVIRKVDKLVPNIDWVLLGSANGHMVAEKIAHSLHGQHSILNHVNSMSLNNVFQTMKSANLLIAADGGLLHVGRAADVPIIGLFAGDIHPRMRFASNDLAHVIHAEADVSDINPEIVASSINKFFKEGAKGLTVEYVGAIPDCSE